MKAISISRLLSAPLDTVIRPANEEGKTISVKKGEAFAQGIFLPFGITLDDDASDVRTGGFGSTDH